MKQAQKFLTSKKQVRLQAIVRGRERARNEETAERINQIFEEHLSKFGKCASPARADSLNLTINPKK